MCFLSWFICTIFTPGVFWPYERSFKNLLPDANLHPSANLLLLSRWSKFICTRLHPGVNCAYERKNVYFLYVLIGDFDILQTCIVYDFVLNDIKVNFKLFLSK